MPRPRASLFSLTVFLSQLVGLRLASHVVSHGPGHPSNPSDYVLEDEEDFPVRHLVGAIFDEDDVTLALHHKNGQSIMAILEDEGDCIYSGYMVGCPTSTALVTGCKGEMQGVQIQSKVFGDMIFDLQDGVVMPLKKRYKRALDPDIDYDYDDSSDFGVLEEFADLDNAEAADFPQPPPKLVLNLNVYMDKEWSAEFGRTGVSKAKKILTQAKLLWAHDSLSTKVDFLFEDDKFHESPKHLLINKGNLRRELPSLLGGPDETPSGEKMAHLYLTVKKPNEPTYTHGLAVDNGMCSSREKPRVMVLYHNSELVTAMTVAHEIGHIVGMEHDFLLGRRNHKCVSGGKDGETVMAYGDARQKFSTCSNEDFKLYYNRVVLEKAKFCLQAQSTDCSCNGISDPFLGGGKCTPGVKGLWCFVNQNTGCKTDRLYGKFVSTDPCKPKPCACSGETDITGGGLCGAWCYVAEEASCADVQPYYSKFFSRAACGTRRTTRLPPTRRTRQTTTTTTTTMSGSGGGCSSACVFPFTYWGVTYNSCTSDDHDRPWCATATDMSGDVTTHVNCDEDCPTGACKIYRGRYISAGNNAFKTSKANLQECANWCAEIPACRAWTFNSDDMNCWPKSADGEKGCLDGACEKGALSTLTSPWVSGTKSCGAN